MHNILVSIVEKKKRDLEQQKEKNIPSFRNLFSREKIGLIAEVKFASPTHTNLGSHEELLKRVKAYKEAGASAISLITEKYYFKGDGTFVEQVKNEVSLPVLQKDFVIDMAQIHEAKQFGSDALLLIARLVTTEQLQQFVDICLSIGIEPVVEINNEEDLQKALETKTKIIAVNARDLETFSIDIDRACLFIKKIPSHFIKLAFSGINSSAEVAQYKESGANGVLVGTSLMKAKNIGEFIKNLEL